MKQFLFAILLCVSTGLFSQNTFPTPSGNVGIGTASPTSKLHVFDNNRNYYVNRGISGITEDGQGINYMLLHLVYTGTLSIERFVMGKITGIRGGSAQANRKWTVEVNTSAAYNTNRGSMISYSEGTRLVTLTYNSAVYLALEIASNSSLFNFSFTGYAANEALQIVTDEVVSNVQVFQPNYTIGIQGALNVGVQEIGLLNATHMLHVNSPVNQTIARFTTGGIPGADGHLDVMNNTVTPGAYFPALKARSAFSGRTPGIGVIGEANDIVPSTADLANAAVILDGRSKTNTPLTNNNVLAVNSYGQNLVMVKANGSVGIGTTNTYTHKLAVNGSGIFTKVTVKAFGNWPDFVFDSSYVLPGLAATEQYIQQHHHLPGVPSAKEVNQDGIELGDMNARLLQKIEELTLHMIRQQKQIEQLAEENKKIRRQLEKSDE